MFLDGKGYLCFSIRVGGKRCGACAHKMQAYRKYGLLIFSTGIEIRHLNGNTEDNSCSNISIGTHSENMMDKPQYVRKKWALNAGLKNSPLSNDDVLKIRELYEGGGHTYKQLAFMYGIKSKGTICDIINRKTWKHII